MAAKDKPSQPLGRRHISAPEVLTLRWAENEALPGLWVRCSTRVNLGDLAQMGQALQGAGEEQIAAAGELFAPCLLAWNEAEPDVDENGEYVYEDGEIKATDVPATPEGWRSRNPIVQLTIMRRFFDALGGVSGPLSIPSSNGAHSAGPSRVMTAA